MAKLTIDQLIDGFKELSLLEVSEFVKKFEETFDVSAAAPAAVAVAAAPAADAAPAEEKDSFDVVLESFGDKKLGVIKAVRSVIPTLGLGEAKALVESAPKAILEGANKDDAQKAKETLEAEGATVSVK